MHPKTLIRRTHSPEFKAQVLAACRQPGASIAAVALAHGLNANVVRKWLVGIGMKRFGQSLPTEGKPAPAAPMQFLPVGLAARDPDGGGGAQDIRLDLDCERPVMPSRRYDWTLTLERAIAQVHSRQARNLICIDISTCALLYKLKLATNHNFC